MLWERPFEYNNMHQYDTFVCFCLRWWPQDTHTHAEWWHQHKVSEGKKTEWLLVSPFKSQCVLVSLYCSHYARVCCVCLDVQLCVCVCVCVCVRGCCHLCTGSRDPLPLCVCTTAEILPSVAPNQQRAACMFAGSYSGMTSPSLSV